jgi:hypothetical protein
MQLPPVSNPPSASSPLIRGDNATVLTKIAGLPQGQIVEVMVEKVAAITPEQRDALLKQLNEQMQQLQKAPQTPAVKAQIQQLNEQQQLLQSPPLKLVTLQLPDRPLLTYTDKPVVAGQTLQVLVSQQGQRLAIVDIPAPLPAIPTTALTTAAIQPAAENSLRNLLNIASSLLFPAAPDNKAANLNTAPANNTLANAKLNLATNAPLDKLAVQKALVETLRQILPLRDVPTEIFQAFPIMQQLPGNVRQLLLPATVQQALKSFAEQLRSPAQLSNPQVIPLALKNSGTFFEQKIASQMLQTAANGGAVTGNSKNVVSLQLTHQDLKGALLHLLSRLRQESGVNLRLSDIPNPSSPPPAAPSTTQQHAVDAYTSRGGADAALKLPEMPQGLLSFLQQIPQRSHQELSAKTLRNQLMMLMQQHTLLGLGKIQLQQTHTLGQQLANADGNTAAQSFIFDIPVRYGADIHQFHLQLRQEWLEEKDSEKRKSSSKVKQWMAMLRFDLPHVGGVYVQLQAGQDLSVSLWAERQETLTLARSKMNRLKEQLEAEGITLKNLQCLNGLPPDYQQTLNYSLVDLTL